MSPTDSNQPPAQPTRDQLLAQFGNQAPTLHALLQNYCQPLKDRIDTLEQENTSLKSQLATAKNNATFSLDANDMASLGAVIASASTASRPKIDAALPSKFEGKPEQVDPFLSAARLYLVLKSSAFSDESQKMLWLLALCSGPAEPWARTKINDFLAGNIPYSSYSELEKDIRESFCNVSRVQEARHNLQSMKWNAKSKESLGSFVNRFRPEAEASDFDDKTLCFFFAQALPEQIQVQISSMNQGDIPCKIEDWYRLSQRLHAIKASAHQMSEVFNVRSLNTSTPPATAHPAPVLPAPEPMDIDAHCRARRCFNCGELGHIKRSCPQPRRQQQVRATQDQPGPPKVPSMEEVASRAVELLLVKIKEQGFQPSQQ